jgi:hypothetical protein
MSGEMFWAPRFMGSKYIMKTRGSKEYMSKTIELEEFWFTVMILDLYEN